MTGVEEGDIESVPSAIVYVRAQRPAADEATLRPLARLALLHGWTAEDQAAYEGWRKGEEGKADVAEGRGEASDGEFRLNTHSITLNPNTDDGADETPEVVSAGRDDMARQAGRESGSRIAQVGISIGIIALLHLLTKSI